MAQWRIDENKVLGSGNPTDDQLEKLFQQGFRTIISLLDESQQRTLYDKIKAKDLGFTWHSIPVRDFTAPTMEKFKEFLEIMNKAEANVIIHCQGGSGRTGTMGAAYWIAKGMPAHKAIDKVRRTNPGAIEEHEQEESLYELVSILSEFEVKLARQTADKK